MAEDSLPCSKRNLEVANNEFSESRSSTQTSLVKHRHIWTIDNLSFCNEFREILVSPTFSAGIDKNNSEWRLHLYPGTQAMEDHIACSIQLIACNMNEILMTYKCRILNAKGVNLKTLNNSGSYRFKKKDCPTALSGLFHKSRASLFDEENETLFHDKLTIVCEIIYKTGRKNILLDTIKTPQQSTLTMEFASLLENKQLSDVTLCAGEREFPAHKAILSAQSPVFRAMFEHDMEENKSNRVEITDIDEEGLNEVLRYMYTGEINILEIMAPHLLSVAEKYELGDLKIQCEEALVKRLSLENVVEMLILSDRFRATELMKQVKKFIFVHSLVIVNTPEFYSMIKTFPYLGVLFCNILGGNASIL